MSLFSGLIALIGSYLIIEWINKYEFLDNGQLELNPTVLIFGIIAAFVLGILFGVLPALRLSRLNIVKSLKS